MLNQTPPNARNLSHGYISTAPAVKHCEIFNSQWFNMNTQATGVWMILGLDKLRNSCSGFALFKT